MKKIGNQDIYIEIDIDTYSNNMAYLILVIDGFKLGTLSSPTYIPSFIHSLNSLLLEDSYFNNSININLFKKMVNNGDLENKNGFTLEETFDDFMKRCIRGNDNFYFYFKLYKNHYYIYDNILENIPIIKVINREKFILFLNEIKFYLG